MTLQYERLNHILIISKLGNQLSNYDLYVPEKDYEIKFSDYVKSQIHLNIVDRLYDRRFSDYVNTLFFLRGNTTYFEDAMKVLYYFYSDIYDFLCNNPNNVRVYLDVDAELGEDFKVNILPVLDIVKKFNPEEIISDGQDRKLSEEERWVILNIRSADDLQTKPDSCALACVLSKILNGNGNQRLILTDESPSGTGTYYNLSN